VTDEQIPQQNLCCDAEMAALGPIMFPCDRFKRDPALIGGQFMEPSAGLLSSVAPLFFPIAIELGIDPIQLGIIMVGPT